MKQSAMMSFVIAAILETTAIGFEIGDIVSIGKPGDVVSWSIDNKGGTLTAPSIDFFAGSNLSLVSPIDATFGIQFRYPSPPFLPYGPELRVSASRLTPTDVGRQWIITAENAEEFGLDWNSLADLLYSPQFGENFFRAAVSITANSDAGNRLQPTGGFGYGDPVILDHLKLAVQKYEYVPSFARTGSNGIVNFFPGHTDFLLTLDVFAKITVPEPSSLWLLLIGIGVPPVRCGRQRAEASFEAIEAK